MNQHSMLEETLSERFKGAPTRRMSATDVMAAANHRLARRRARAGSALALFVAGALIISGHLGLAPSIRPAQDGGDVTASRQDRAATWASALPTGSTLQVAAWPRVDQADGHLQVRLQGGSVAIPAGIASLARPERLHDGWLFLGRSQPKVGQSGSAQFTTILRVNERSLAATVVVSSAGIRDYLVDPVNARVAWLEPKDASRPDGQNRLTVKDLDGLGGSSVALPSGDGVLATWAGQRITLVREGTPTTGPGAVTSVDAKTGKRTSVALDGQPVAVRALHLYAGPSNAALLELHQVGRASCVVRLTDTGATSLDVTTVTCADAADADTAPLFGFSISPGARWALIGPIGPVAPNARGGSQLFSLGTLAPVTDEPEAVAALQPSDVAWQNQDVLVSAFEIRSAGRVVSFRLNVVNRQASQFPGDARILRNPTGPSGEILQAPMG